MSDDQPTPSSPQPRRELVVPARDVPGLDVSVDIDVAGEVTVHVRGELDRAGRTVVDDVLRDLDRYGMRQVHIDASGITFSDSTIVDLVATWSHRFQRRGGALALVAVPAHVRRVIELLGEGELIDDAAGDRKGPAFPRPLMSWAADLTSLVESVHN